MNFCKSAVCSAVSVPSSSASSTTPLPAGGSRSGVVSGAESGVTVRLSAAGAGSCAQPASASAQKTLAAHRVICFICFYFPYIFYASSTSSR